MRSRRKRERQIGLLIVVVVVVDVVVAGRSEGYSAPNQSVHWSEINFLLSTSNVRRLRSWQVYFQIGGTVLALRLAATAKLLADPG